MSTKNGGLGKGLTSIFGSDVTSMLDDIQNGQVQMEKQTQQTIPVAAIRPNPYQPRKVFDETALAQLAQSIAEHGVFTPVLVKKGIQGYDLIAGERRLRASKLAGLAQIPAIIVEMDDQQMMEIALLENIQRENLNVIEEARAYEKLMKTYNYTQEQLSKRVGKSREHIANLLRLLRLPDDIQDEVVEHHLSMGQARALLSLKDEDAMRKIGLQAIKNQLSVRKVEQLVKEYGKQKEKQPVEENLFEKEAKKQLEEFFQSPVHISASSISIHIENEQDLTRILEKLDLIEQPE